MFAGFADDAPGPARQSITGGLKMRNVILLVALLLAGCMTHDERIAAENAKDDQKCLSYGARPGTDAYVSCRAQLDGARRTADAIEDAAPSGNRSTTCFRNGNTVNCY